MIDVFRRNKMFELRFELIFDEIQIEVFKLETISADFHWISQPIRTPSELRDQVCYIDVQSFDLNLLGLSKEGNFELLASCHISKLEDQILHFKNGENLTAKAFITVKAHEAVQEYTSTANFLVLNTRNQKMSIAQFKTDKFSVNEIRLSLNHGLKRYFSWCVDEALRNPARQESNESIHMSHSRILAIQKKRMLILDQQMDGYQPIINDGYSLMVNDNISGMSCI